MKRKAANSSRELIKSKLNLEAKRIQLFKKFYSYLVPTFYNCHPGNMKFINSENKFKTDVKIYLSEDINVPRLLGSLN